MNIINTKIDPFLQKKINEMSEQTGIGKVLIKQANNIPLEPCPVNTLEEIMVIITNNSSEDDSETFVSAKEKASNLLEEKAKTADDLDSVKELLEYIGYLTPETTQKLYLKLVELTTSIPELEKLLNIEFMFIPAIEGHEVIVENAKKRLIEIYPTFLDKNLSIEQVKKLYEQNFSSSKFPDVIKKILLDNFFKLFKEKAKSTKNLKELSKMEDLIIRRSEDGFDYSEFWDVLIEARTVRCTEALNKARTFESIREIYAYSPHDSFIESLAHEKMGVACRKKVKNIKELEEVVKLYRENADYGYDIIWEISYERWKELFVERLEIASTKEDLLALVEITPAGIGEDQVLLEYEFPLIRKLAPFYGITMQ